MFIRWCSDRSGMQSLGKEHSPQLPGEKGFSTFRGREKNIKILDLIFGFQLMID